MDIDLAALRALERERDLSLEVLIPAIEQALLTAYHRTDGSFKIARVELDRKTGHVVVLAREEDHMAGLAVQLHAGDLERPIGAVIGGQQGLLDRRDQHLKAEVAFAFQRP